MSSVEHRQEHHRLSFGPLRFNVQGETSSDRVRGNEEKVYLLIGTKIAREKGDSACSVSLPLCKEVPMAGVDFQQILTAAQRLPKPSQAQLVSALLQEQGAAPPPDLRTLNRLDRRRVACLSRFCISASTRQTAQATLTFTSREEKVAARPASGTGYFTRRKRPCGLCQSESRLHARFAQDVRHGPIPQALRHAILAAAQGRCAYCLRPSR